MMKDIWSKITNFLFGKTFLIKIALKKGLKRLVQALISLAIAKGAEGWLGQFGLQVDWQAIEAAAIGIVFGGIEMIRNYLKNRLGWKFL